MIWIFGFIILECFLIGLLTTILLIMAGLKLHDTLKDRWEKSNGAK